MNTESKAKELIDKFIPYADKKAKPSFGNRNIPMSQGVSMGSLLSNQSGITYNHNDLLQSAKQCALIAVDEILTSKAAAYPNQEIENGQVFKEYWEEVKQKIKQL